MAGAPVQHRQIQLGFDMLRVQMSGLEIGAQRFVALPATLERNTQVVPSQSVIGPERQGTMIGRDGLGPIAPVRECQPQIEVRIHVLR